MNIEQIILSHLIYDNDYNKKVMPFLKEEHFTDVHERIIFKLISEYVGAYNNFPSIEALSIELRNSTGLNEEVYRKTNLLIDSLKKTDAQLEWLVDKSETFCQDKALYLALSKSIEIMNDKKHSLSKGAIPHLLTDALGVTFDTHIGHNFLGDVEARWEYYHRKEIKVPWSINLMNIITDGGASKKTLNVAMAPTGVGKTLFLCDNAVYQLMQGYKVLYITLEISKEEIAKRMEANYIDVGINSLKHLPKASYDSKHMNNLA